jgi:hypothetical protein
VRARPKYATKKIYPKTARCAFLSCAQVVELPQQNRLNYDNFVSGLLEYLFNHLVSVGINGKIPFFGGFRVNVGISYEQGKLDAGVLIEGDIPAASASKMLVRGGVNVSYDTGDFDSNRGSTNTQFSGHYKSHGVDVSKDTKTGEFSGASLNFGPGIGASVSGTRTNTMSVRQVYREIVQPIIDRVGGAPK